MVKYDVNKRIPLFHRSIKSNKLPDIYNLLRSKILFKDYYPHYFNYGRNALSFLFKKLNFKRKIVFPAFICPSIAYSAIESGAKPIFVDADLDDFNINTNALDDLDFSEVDAVLAAHTFGFPFNVRQILKFRGENRFHLIEDCAHAFFSRINERFVGNFGDSVLFSMNKQISNLPGAILLSDYRDDNHLKEEGIFENMRSYLSIIDSPHQIIQDLIRVNKKLPEESSVFTRNLKKPSSFAVSNFIHGFLELERSIKKKNEISKYYYEKLRTNSYFIPQKIRKGNSPSWFNFNVRLKPDISNIRDQLLINLRKKGIFCDRVWYKPPVFLNIFGHSPENYPNASLLANSIINLPLDSNYSKEDIDFLIDSMEDIINKLM